VFSPPIVLFCSALAPVAVFNLPVVSAAEKRQTAQSLAEETALTNRFNPAVGFGDSFPGI
jgi:hypothetical protein